MALKAEKENKIMTLFLRQIEVECFKSFKARIVIGPFDRFTCIVGPNGHGKSNIVDAVNFVLGEKVNKLRVKCLNDLIYGANTDKPVSNSLSVKADFITNDDIHLCFMRIVDQSESKYSINNKFVSYETYMSTLSNYGINSKLHTFIILQGTIDLIASITPIKRTKLLEEISGSISFKKEYDRLRHDFLNKENKLNDIARKKKDLLLQLKAYARSAKQAKLYTELNHKNLECLTDLYMFQLYHLEEDIKILLASNKQASVQLNQLNEQKNEQIEILKTEKNENDTLNNTLTAVENNLFKEEETKKQITSNFLTLKEELRHLEEKLNSLSKDLRNNQKRKENHMKTINELREELQKIEEMKEKFQRLAPSQLNSQGSSLELDSQQVDTYHKLKRQAEQKVGFKMYDYNLQKSKQSDEQELLVMSNAKKSEYEIILSKKKSLRNEMKIRLEKLEKSIKAMEAVEDKQKEDKLSLEVEIKKSEQVVQFAQNELTDIYNKLNDAKFSNHTISYMRRKTDTIKNLKERFPEVCGRFGDLCQPISERYRIALTKLIGKNMNAIIVKTTKTAHLCINYLKLEQIGRETFLPLDSLLVKQIKNSLRDIKDPKNVKLAYDLLNFPSEISLAVIFVIKNTLVCETAEDARKLAYESFNTRNDCVSLDGILFQKSGIISGGSVDLNEKSKMWTQSQIVDLESRKEELQNKLRSLSSIASKRSELDLLVTQINGNDKKLQYIRGDIINFTKQIEQLEKEIEMIENDIQKESDKIQKHINTIECREIQIKNLEKEINEIEDLVFKNFCDEFNIKNIKQYEEQNLRYHQKREEQRLQLEILYNRIQSQLKYEQEREPDYNISYYENAIKETEQHLKDAKKKEEMIKVQLNEIELKINERKCNYDRLKSGISDVEEKIRNRRKNIDVISRKVLKRQRNMEVVQLKILTKKNQIKEILDDCMIKNIHISKLRQFESNDSNMEENVSSEHNFHIDFTFFKNHYKNRNKKEMEDIERKLNTAAAEIQEKLNAIPQPDLKATRHREKLMDEFSKVKIEWQKAIDSTNNAKKEFELIQNKRCEKFTACLESIDQYVDLSYRKLLNNSSVQANLIPVNPAEPYLGGIEYSCIAPGKRFLSLSSMSGGEKTLAALAFIFAMYNCRPSPFLMLDEVDAALDNENVRSLVQFINDNKQLMGFIVVSLKCNFYGYADSLIGVSRKAHHEMLPQSEIFTLRLSSYQD
ncbi:structural maintenance of chromosomes protein 1A-like [Prorops nasuta]|uniref:structural maintenance of chromosomes protein 1A-like n=1 Tax=Prorops nasuta TaxID=863751 RepID=UPI0034CEF41F